ncbi:unnamed protein product [Mytilus edulis]|uniref:Uncharacterized protein n=1 Tax=Mytilus edulis TaxID=6550 RepID=A0A8S3U7A4_MYTED|nr:unnamed protein product [Mytilus edulis]
MDCCWEGWDRWTPVQQTLFIDIKTGRPNKKYDGKVMKDGYTLIIQNLTENDLNVSYSCLYGVTLGERKFLLEEDVFKSISPTQPNSNGQLSHSEISALIIGVIVLLIGFVTIFIYIWRRRILSNKHKGKDDNLEIEEELEDTQAERKQDTLEIIKVSDVKCQCDQYQMSDVNVISIRCQMSYVICIRCLMSIRSVSDVRCQCDQYQMSDVNVISIICQMLINIDQYQMSDVNVIGIICLMSM